MKSFVIDTNIILMLDLISLAMITVVVVVVVVVVLTVTVMIIDSRQSLSFVCFHP